MPTVSTGQGYETSSAKNSTTPTNTGSTISGVMRLPTRLPENTGSRETIRKAMASV